jgi:hypothetical protein
MWVCATLHACSCYREELSPRHEHMHVIAAAAAHHIALVHVAYNRYMLNNPPLCPQSRWSSSWQTLGHHCSQTASQFHWWQKQQEQQQLSWRAAEQRQQRHKEECRVYLCAGGACARYTLAMVPCSCQCRHVHAFQASAPGCSACTKAWPANCHTTA